jgi:hypothetical protein
MKSRFGHTRLLPLSCALLAFACGSDDGDADETADGGTGGTPGTGGNGGTPGTGGNVDFEGEIAAPTTWTADKTYTLTGHVFVRSTLTIQAGTRILGKAGSSIVVTQDGTIDAQGTADAPIVFTSASPEGSREAGDWGGVVLLGRAPINVDGGNEKIEGFADTETRTGYGGDDPAHNCGTLKYVRIEFAGYELAPDNELNGLSVGACGAGTELDYVQIHKGADDGIEFFGGTASIKHLLVTQADDDSIDWDYGWVGSAQWVIAQQSGLAGDNGIEADNQKDDNDAEPRSNPAIWNLTLVGSNAGPGGAAKSQKGMTLRRGTAAEIRNALIVGFADAPYNIADEATVAQIDAGELVLRRQHPVRQRRHERARPARRGRRGRRRRRLRRQHVRQRGGHEQPLRRSDARRALRPRHAGLQARGGQSGADRRRDPEQWPRRVGHLPRGGRRNRLDGRLDGLPGELIGAAPDRGPGEHRPGRRVSARRRGARPRRWR